MNIEKYLKELMYMSIPKQLRKEDYTEVQAYDQELQDMIFEDNLNEMRL